MFQRQARSSFPLRNIAVLAAAVLGFLYFLLKNVQARRSAVSEQAHEAHEKRDTGLRPAEWFYALREYPNFRPDVETYTRAFADAQAQNAARPRGVTQGFSAPWTLQGPGNIGARVNTIAVHPTNHDVIYIGYSGGGVWKTTDGGTTWRPVFDGQTFLSVGDIAFDPNDPNTVYVGTGDPNISGYPFIGDGLWKTTDGGDSWQYLGLENQRIITKIIATPGASSKLYAATMGLPFERNNDRGLYVGNGSPTGWQQKLFISDDAGIIDLVASPTDPNTLYAAAWDRIRNNQESLVAGENARIWKTSDGGQTWGVLSAGLPEGPQSRIGLAIDANNDQHLVATYASTSLEFLGLYETFDGGQTWALNPCNGLDFGFQSNFAWYFGKVRINPYNSQDIWMLGVTTYRSQDGGQNWEQTPTWNDDVHVDHHDLAFLSAEDFLLATDGGLYRSSDNAASWQKIENNATTQFYRVAANPFQPDYYYGGAQDNGTVAGFSEIINEWQRLYGGDGFQAVFHPSDPNIFYFEYQNGGIAGTTDGGFFDSATEGLDPSDRRHWDMQYILSHHDDNVMYTGTYRLYRSYGHLPVWTPVSEDLTDGIVFGPRYHTISTLDESPLNDDLVYVGTTDGNVQRVNPSSQNTQNVSAGLPDRYVSSVKASPTNANRVFVSHTGYKSNDFAPRIHRSDNQGDTWVPIAGDLPNFAVNDLQILPGYQDSVIFAATDGGVYGTLDGGQHWERLGTGMPFVPVYDLDIQAAQRTLIAGTHARSILSFPLDSLQLGENSSTFSPNDARLPSLKLMPTLANQSTTVRVENLKSRQQVELLVSDFSGRIVWQNSVSGGERREQQIDLQGFAPGIYVVFARTGGKIWGAKKLVVAR
jgi:photosystem II stability/assembly factor-like uncharacterized protein